ncbi:hypothetical protein [Chromobacterium vaccinii]|uniref:hypothetical protein n=1 Tax=Chromobacterium vaccinii TaxID=1108595 RepID=UPI0011C0655E|nr:hypothetical protein [Chromobacterium vaccinii]
MKKAFLNGKDFSFKQIRGTIAAAEAKALAFHLVVSLVVQFVSVKMAQGKDCTGRSCGTS